MAQAEKKDRPDMGEPKSDQPQPEKNIDKKNNPGHRENTSGNQGKTKNPGQNKRHIPDERGGIL